MPSAVRRRGFQGGGVAMDHPRLSSEKNITITLGYEMGIFKSRKKNVFIAGFQLVEPISLGKLRKTQSEGTGRKYPRV